MMKTTNEGRGIMKRQIEIDLHVRDTSPSLLIMKGFLLECLEDIEELEDKLKIAEEALEEVRTCTAGTSIQSKAVSANRISDEALNKIRENKE